MSALASGKNLVVFFFCVLLGIECGIHLLQGHILNHEHSCISLLGLFTILDHLPSQGQLIDKCFDPLGELGFRLIEVFCR